LIIDERLGPLQLYVIPVARATVYYVSPMIQYKKFNRDLVFIFNESEEAKTPVKKKTPKKTQEYYLNYTSSYSL
jgi:hypothetical protein